MMVLSILTIPDKELTISQIKKDGSHNFICSWKIKNNQAHFSLNKAWVEEK
jgi:hypothetical protein